MQKPRTLQVKDSIIKAIVARHGKPTISYLPFIYPLGLIIAYPFTTIAHCIELFQNNELGRPTFSKSLHMLHPVVVPVWRQNLLGNNVTRDRIY